MLPSVGSETNQNFARPYKLRNVTPNSSTESPSALGLGKTLAPGENHVVDASLAVTQNPRHETLKPEPQPYQKLRLWA